MKLKNPLFANERARVEQTFTALMTSVDKHPGLLPEEMPKREIVAAYELHKRALQQYVDCFRLQSDEAALRQILQHFKDDTLDQLRTRPEFADLPPAYFATTHKSFRAEDFRLLITTLTGVEQEKTHFFKLVKLMGEEMGLYWRDGAGWSHKGDKPNRGPGLFRKPKHVEPESKPEPRAAHVVDTETLYAVLYDWSQGRSYVHNQYRKQVLEGGETEYPLMMLLYCYLWRLRDAKVKVSWEKIPKLDASADIEALIRVLFELTSHKTGRFGDYFTIVSPDDSWETDTITISRPLTLFRPESVAETA